ncbi:MAG: peptidase C11, partial [Lachnospiraceae bacterium]|nr:peptidase C11 [Lachnospiraceae bacterium]
MIQSTASTPSVDESVSSQARAKRTFIKGDGSDKVTIMVYLCGTDLESKSGMASNDLAEMARASLSDNVNILIYTGGCKSWKTPGISSKVNQIYLITKGGMKRLVEDDGNKAMTSPSTLTSFIKYCASNYPANRNELILW